MNPVISEGNLYELQSKLRIKYPQLTHADLFASEGNIKDMLGMIAFKLQKTQQEMREIIEGL
jgi:hypothetical protein